MLFIIMCIVFSFIVLFKDIIINLLPFNYAVASTSVSFFLFFQIMYTVSEIIKLGTLFSPKISYNIINISSFFIYKLYR